MKPGFHLMLPLCALLCGCNREERYTGISDVNHEVWDIRITGESYKMEITQDGGLLTTSTGFVKQAGDDFTFFPDAAGAVIFPVTDGSRQYGYKAHLYSHAKERTLVFDSCDIRSMPRRLKLLPSDGR
ncbi:MAG: hypothetical protein QM755_03065 [Luteolibacter sp.]